MGKRHTNQMLDITNEKDPVVQEVIQLLYAAPRSKKEIANQTNTSIDQVHRIYQLYFSNNKRRVLDDSLMPTQANVQKSIESKIEENKSKKKEATMIREEVKGEVVENPVVAVAVPVVEEEKEMVKEEAPEQSVYSRRYTEDEILAALSDVEKGMNVDKVAAKYGANRSTIYNWAKKMGLNMKKRCKNHADAQKIEAKNIQEEVKKETSVETVPVVVEKKASAFPFRKIGNTDATIKCMLINARHEFPCTKYIFDNINDDKIFNFDWFERTAKNWIITNIPKNNGVWLKGIDCYVTGLPAASIALCKVCKELEVNLTFLHFNRETQGYEYQVVYDDYPVVNKNAVKEFGAYFADGIEIFIHENAEIEELINSSTFYCISRRTYDKNATEASSEYDTRVKTVVSGRYLFKDIAEAYACLPNIIDANNKSTVPSLIVLNEVLRDGTFWVFKDAILKSHNPAFNNLVRNNK